MAQVDREVCVKDLMDFFLRWSEFRESAVEVSQLSELEDHQKAVVHWLIILADRISQADLAPRPPSQ